MEELVRSLFERGLGDAKVQSISWVERDLRIELIPTGGRAPLEPICLGFQGVSRVRIDLDYGEYIGQPLVFSAEVEQVDGSWKVVFEFGGAPDGLIAFECIDACQIDKC